MESLLKDLRYCIRVLSKNPGFTSISVVTLALAIGANTMIFSVIEATLLRPLPYKDPSRLALLTTADPGDPVTGTSYANFEVCRSQSQAFEDLAVYYRNTGWSRVTLTVGDEPESVQGAFVSANTFPLMGVAPLFGRTFTPDEQTRRERVVVLSHSLWVRRFGASTDVLNKTLQIDGADFQVIAVMPATFQFPAREAQFWAPITTNRYWNDPELAVRSGSHNRNFYMRWNVVGRLRPGVTEQAAQAEMNVIASGLEQADTGLNQGLGIKVVPLRVEPGPNMRQVLFVLFAAVIFVLLIACSNVANLVLARGRTREREMAIRAALGATRSKLIRQMLTESATLALLSGCLGLLLAEFGIRLVVSFGPRDVPRLEQAGIDPVVLAFTFGVSLFAAIIFGLAPAWKISRIDLNESLKAVAKGASGGTGLKRAHGLLVVAEFALSVVLLTGAGLLIRSFLAVQSVDLGFDPERVLTMRITMPPGTPAAERIAHHESVLETVRALPGVQAVGAINGLFELGETNNLGLRSIEGRAVELREQWTALTWKTISGDFFQTMGTSLLKGRFFSEEDGPNTPLVAIIDESMGRRYWPGEDPIGKRFKGQDRRGQDDDWITVIGLVKEMRRQGWETEPTAHIFIWYKQDNNAVTDLLVRTTSNPLALADMFRTAVRSLDQTAILSNVTTIEQQLSEHLSPRRFQTWLLGLFSFIALLLAAVGIYGVMRYSVSQRTREIGIRMALGAQPGHVLGMILREGMLLAVAGLSIGLAGAWWLTELLSTLLYGVTPSDPVTFAAVIILLVGVGGLASFVPAWRATKVDPMVALRNE